MRDFSRNSLLSFVLKSFQLSGIKETHKRTVNGKWGVVSLKAPSGGIFHSSLYEIEPSFSHILACSYYCDSYYVVLN